MMFKYLTFTFKVVIHHPKHELLKSEKQLINAKF